MSSPHAKVCGSQGIPDFVLTGFNPTIIPHLIGKGGKTREALEAKHNISFRIATENSTCEIHITGDKINVVRSIRDMGGILWGPGLQEEFQAQIPGEFYWEPSGTPLNQHYEAYLYLQTLNKKITSWKVLDDKTLDELKWVVHTKHATLRIDERDNKNTLDRVIRTIESGKASTIATTDSGFSPVMSSIVTDDRGSKIFVVTGAVTLLMSSDFSRIITFYLNSGRGFGSFAEWKEFARKKKARVSEARAAPSAYKGKKDKSKPKGKSKDKKGKKSGRD